MSTPVITSGAGDEVALAVRAVLAEVLHRSVEDIALDASLENQLGMDSLTSIEAAVALEERLGVTMPEFATPDELGLDTVADLVRLTAERVAELRARRSH